VRPGMEVFEVSSRTGAGMDRCLRFLLQRRDEARERHG